MKTEKECRDLIEKLQGDYKVLLGRLNAALSVKEINSIGDRMGRIATQLGTLGWVLNTEESLLPDEN
jgi:hypothetical protein